MYDLERYIKDDVLRHGNRLAELEKKVANAYSEAVRIFRFIVFVNFLSLVCLDVY